MADTAPLVRPAVETDADEIARLLTLLGHPTTRDDVAARWTAWRDEGNFALVAAGENERLLGLATMHRMHVLHRPHAVGRITALVVDEGWRGRGIGRALVAAAERELAARACGLIEVTSNNRRVDAHAFYERLGYERTSIRLAKVLDTGAS